MSANTRFRGFVMLGLGLAMAAGLHAGNWPSWRGDLAGSGLAKGETDDVERCEPGGDETKEDIQLIYQVWAELKQAASET